MRWRSLRTRLTLWYTSLLTLTVLVLGGVAYTLLVYSLTHEVDVALRSVAQALVNQTQRGPSPVLPAEIEALFRRFFRRSPWEHYFELRDPVGRRDPRWQRSPSDTLPLSPQALRHAAMGLPTFETSVDLGPYPVRILTMPMREAGRVTSLIQVGMSLESVHLTRQRFLLTMAGVLPLGLLLAGGGGWLFARRALAPVDRMTAAARRISAAHLAERLEETGAGDELDRLANTLNAMLGRLDDAFRQIRQFSADASHELQTPLTILKGELEVALRAPRSPEAYQRHLQSALEEVERMATLVDGLLLLARADAGVLRMDRQPVDLAQLVAEVVGQTRVLAAAQRLTIEPGPLDPATIQGDYERLRRLLLNLVDNGIKYTPPGGRVTLSLHRCGSWASLRVADTGIGLSLAEQGQVFQRFYRADSARAHGQGGAGLGLCIAQSIAEAHGGHIQIDSTPGHGSTFTVCLPLHSSPEC
jgi:two-component system OmpR family sensor kinase